MPHHELTAADAAERIRRGTLSPVALVEACLARIGATEEKLQAWVTVDREGALKVARQCDEEARRGHFRGPLHGVPIGVKDIYYVGGMRCTAGSKVLPDFVAPFDAASVARLRQAGAIILGKTQTTEFATFDPAPTGKRCARCNSSRPTVPVPARSSSVVPVAFAR